MGETGVPVLLVGGVQSPHGYQLKPSQVETLHHADIVFYIAPGLETFLARPLETLPAAVKKAALADAPGLALLVRRGGDEGDAHGHGHGDAAYDPHIWLDVGNAKIMAAEIARLLGDVYPSNRAVYERNSKVLIGNLDALDEDLKILLEPVRTKPYIVFHDAFQYFEHRYGLSNEGAITLEPEQEPGVRHIAEIREKVRSSGARCVFSEPQFKTRLVQTVIEGTDSGTGILDEHGADIPEGPELYGALMRRLAGGFSDCLGSPAP